ncbi:hypothetical protein [Pusillimonas minor]|uniref:Uncharacterized protein n=1 Tax=Pusillimonas minor TaxID=2697024 RepID=A0A842HS32_9BURK|nr:hypothetical protein [Pusillimonas minor]MBC2770180.1 hypothetical protein [Pusillimonas minor]
MKLNIKQFALAVALGVSCYSTAAADLKISALAADATELDLFSPAADGAYIKSVELSALKFPIAILEDRNGGFIIRFEGKKYYVNAPDVVANNVYKVTAECDNTFSTELVGATRGIAGKGC